MKKGKKEKKTFKQKLKKIALVGVALYSAGVASQYTIGNYYRNLNQEDKAIQHLNYAANLCYPLRKGTSAYVLQVLDRRTQYYESMKMYLNYHTRYEEEKGMGNARPACTNDSDLYDIRRMYYPTRYPISIDDTYLTFTNYINLPEELEEKYQVNLYKNYKLLSVENPEKLVSWLHMREIVYVLENIEYEVFMHDEIRSFASHPKELEVKLKKFNNKYEEITPVNYIYLDIEYALMGSKAVRGIKEYMKMFPKEVEIYGKEYNRLCKNISSISLKYKDETEKYPDLDRVLDFINTSLSR